MKGRKVKIVLVAPEYLGDLCRSTNDKCIIIGVDGIPEDSEFIGAQYNWNKDVFECKFYHESFDEIKEGFNIPRQRVQYTKYYT